MSTLAVLGFLRCSGCSGLCRGYPSIGKSGKRYFYYDCPSPQCKFRVPTEETHTLYKEKLQDMTPSGGVLNLFRAIVEEAWERKIESFQCSSGDTKEEQALLHKEQADIVQLLKQCADNPALVAQLKNDYQITEQKIATLQNPKEKPTFLKYDKTEVLDRCCTYLKTADELWGKSPVEAQYRFQYMTFPDGIAYDYLQDKRTPKVSLVYAALGEIQNGASSLAASRGIEPLLPG